MSIKVKVQKQSVEKIKDDLKKELDSYTAAVSSGKLEISLLRCGLRSKYHSGSNERWRGIITCGNGNGEFS